MTNKERMQDTLEAAYNDISPKIIHISKHGNPLDPGYYEELGQLKAELINYYNSAKHYEALRKPYEQLITQLNAAFMRE